MSLAYLNWKDRLRNQHKFRTKAGFDECKSKNRQGNWMTFCISDGQKGYGAEPSAKVSGKSQGYFGLSLQFFLKAFRVVFAACG